MSQTVLKYKLLANAKEYEHITRRYACGRSIIRKIRKILGTAIQDIEDDSFAYALGKVPAKNLSKQALKSIQNASEISKWVVNFDKDSFETDTLQGELILILENTMIDTKLLDLFIIQSSALAGVNLKQIGIETTEVDYSVSDSNITYRINNLYPSISRRMSKEERLDKLPTSMLPNDRKRHAKTIGDMLKRHIIETAQYHGLEVEEIEKMPIFVMSRWVDCPSTNDPKNPKNEDDFFNASIEVIFLMPLELQGHWFAGGYRHINSGLIEKSTNDDYKKLKTGGVFVL